MTRDLEDAGCKNIVSKIGEWSFEINEVKGKLIQKGANRFSLIIDNKKIYSSTFWRTCATYLISLKK